MQLLPIAFDAVPKTFVVLYILCWVPKHNKLIWLSVFNILLICILQLEVAANDAISGKVIFIALLEQLQNIIWGNGNVNVIFPDIVIDVSYELILSNECLNLSDTLNVILLRLLLIYLRIEFDFLGGHCLK